jgi:hypothetical protein
MACVCIPQVCDLRIFRIPDVLPSLVDLACSSSEGVVPTEFDSRLDDHRLPPGANPELAEFLQRVHQQVSQKSACSHAQHGFKKHSINKPELTYDSQCHISRL